MADLFCGAGGTSDGAVDALGALGHLVNLTAINHWPVAVNTHTANHPTARHLCASLDALNPRDLFKDGELDLLWASPECTHHSVARGGKPINDQSRATAWCVARWAEALRPGVIMIENVPEFQTWGPIGSNGQPLKSRKSETFLAWVQALRSLGYKVDWRVLVAADYGDPTTRRRLFVQAVRGRRNIVWPDATHQQSTEADLFGKRLPWVPARAIIDWSKQGTSIFERKRPLSPKTMDRIWSGLEKFGLNPSIIAMENKGHVRSVDRPLNTVTTAKGGAHAVVNPFLIELRGTTDQQCRSTAKSIEQPVGTITSGGIHHGLAEPYLINTAHAGERRAIEITEPLPTVAGNRGEVALIDPYLLPQQSDGALRPVSEPVPTVATAGAIAVVQPFLIEYYGQGGAESVDTPLNTVTTKDRHALVKPVVTINGERYTLDIRFRMLQPNELAAAQGFRSDYQFTGTKTEQVKQIGNAVPRNLARALVYAVMSQKQDVSQLWTVKKEAA
jgi:DNA (cytosine-5)-methyltransferase 1